MNIEQLYRLFLLHPVICTDTRKITSGCIFFALKGDKFDANTLAKQAIEQGAVYAVIDDPAYRTDERFIVVNDVLTALQHLARYHRRQLTIPVIGLTGTNGKTTTKELISAVLSQKFKTLATQSNLNNHIGVPLTILSITAAHQVAVIEMGANHQKEIELLCSIAQPTHGLITNIGKAHLEGFGGVEGVKKGKGELYDFLSHEKGTAFINGDDPVLMEMQKARHLQKVILYGRNNKDSTVSGEITENEPLVAVRWTNLYAGESYIVKTRLTGAYNLDNILAAICMGVYFGMEAGAINNGITGYDPQNNRSQIKYTGNNTLICDYYNANPSSMAVAIENIGKLKAGHKVLILGDMFELGDESAAEHEAIIKKALDTDADERIFIGKDFLSQKLKAEGQELKKYTFYATVEDAAGYLKAHPVKNATILIKGSRGMALERLADLF